MIAGGSAAAAAADHKDDDNDGTVLMMVKCRLYAVSRSQSTRRNKQTTINTSPSVAAQGVCRITNAPRLYPSIHHACGL